MFSPEQCLRGFGNNTGFKKRRANINESESEKQVSGQWKMLLQKV